MIFVTSLDSLSCTNVSIIRLPEGSCSLRRSTSNTLHFRNIVRFTFFYIYLYIYSIYTFNNFNYKLPYIVI